MSYKWCYSCENTFLEDDLEVVCVSHGDRYSPPEYITRCPCCGEAEPDLEDAYECEHCGGVYHAYKFSEVDDMCQKCFDDSVNKLKKYVEAHGDKADNAVLSFLLDF